MSNVRFLLDANCFIEPSKTCYPFCFAPAFWDALIQGHKSQMIFTLSKVKKEILVDEIRDWFGQQDFPGSFVLKETTDTVRNYAMIQKWVTQHPFFSQVEKNKFADNKTDGYLVAHAKAYNMTVVTQEKLIVDPTTKKVKIPNLCQQFGVQYLNLFEMLKQLDVRFILEQ